MKENERLAFEKQKDAEHKLQDENEEKLSFLHQLSIEGKKSSSGSKSDTSETAKHILRD